MFLFSVGLSITGCGHGRQGTFLGTVIAQTGACGLSAGADGVMHGSLLVWRDDVVFAPEGGVVTLPGRMDGFGHIVAEKTLSGADHKPFSMAFEGDLRGDAVTGVFATPRCRAGVSFERAR